MNVHHPPERKGDTYHVVALTSSTLGSIKLDTPPNEEGNDENRKSHEVGIEKQEEFKMGMIEAKGWSKMIDEKIARVAPKTPNIDEKRTRIVPKTPIRTPPGEPETINVQDLMEGLEETSPLRLREHIRSFSFHVSTDSVHSQVDSPERRVEKDGLRSPKKTWFDVSDKHNYLPDGNLISEAIVAEFDPELISAFRKALQELSPTNAFHAKPHDHNQQQEGVMNGVLEEHNVNRIMELDVIEKKLSAITPIEVTREENTSRGLIEGKGIDGSVPHNGHAYVNGFEDNKENAGFLDNEYVHTNGHIEKERVVLYFTSLRGVRKTYEDCGYVRLILKGFGVRVDERDVSMHSGFREELKERLGEGFKGSLPKVFVGDKYIGGVEEIRRMHEDGQLEKVLGACEMLDCDGGNLVSVCEACGDVRFVPCETCSGSCKIYYEYEEAEELEEQDESGFQRCPDCNENGLVRCPICCY